MLVQKIWIQFWDDDWKEKSGEIQQWPTNLEDRLSFSKSLASWAPGLKKHHCQCDFRISRGDHPRCSKLSSDELRNMQSWEAHIRQGHCPFRRDCAVCIDLVEGTVHM